MKKMMGMMMMGAAGKMAAMIPLAMAGLFVLAGKALIVSKPTTRHGPPTRIGAAWWVYALKPSRGLCQWDVNRPRMIMMKQGTALL
ncbi:jg22295 [Pararge aegeria aegeria]|uniref:Jg22295 protein n=1 Tax=Pararge aegeria aegeria TaxID=348720 RepID=A0A8S4SNG6_9NEOP|nr:jg22295 [Pararge aegeria aegeria]